MFKINKVLAAGLAAALLSVGSAHADTSVIFPNPGTPGDFDLTWSVGNTQSGGATGFDDFYIFDILDAQDISVDLSAIKGSFSGFGFAFYDFTDGTLLKEVDVPSFPGLNISSLSWSDIVLTSGEYELEVQGVYTGSSGGSYTGTMTGVPVVPEPQNLALMLAGMGAIAALARRRRNTQA